MASQLYCFADEAGNFDFRPAGSGASRFFILTSATLDGCEAGNDLLELRRSLTVAGRDLPDHFHATEDEQSVRDAVFAALAPHRLRVDATILEKAKAHPDVRSHS